MAIPEGSSLDHAGVDRRTYEPQNCGNSRPHRQHIHTVSVNYKLNCPGVLGPRGLEEIATAAWGLVGEMSAPAARAVERLVREAYERGKEDA
jgi:hypothetical protein